LPLPEGVPDGSTSESNQRRRPLPMQLSHLGAGSCAERPDRSIVAELAPDSGGDAPSDICKEVLAEEDLRTPRIRELSCDQLYIVGRRPLRCYPSFMGQNCDGKFPSCILPGSTPSSNTVVSS
jgi:hypothetical protein